MATSFTQIVRYVSKFVKTPTVQYINISKRWGATVAIVNATGNTVNWLAHSEEHYKYDIPNPLTGVALSYVKGFCYGIAYPITIPLTFFRLSLAMAERDERWLFPVILLRWKSDDPKYSFKDSDSDQTPSDLGIE